MNLPFKTLGVMALLVGLGATAVGLSSFRTGVASSASFAHPGDPVDGIDKNDSATSVKAFLQVYKVLMSPRCMNCHPSGDVPLQGDDSHLHIAAPKRGKEGKGVYSMKCGNCHQPENLPGLHLPPGDPNWHLPPADMKMVFQGKTPRQLALQLMDPKLNGHKDKKALLEHAHDGLVKAGWTMGGDRSKPPLTHPEFVKQWNTWINTGGYAPAK